MNRIYTEKILPFPDYGLTEIGLDRATEMALNGEGMIYSNLGYFYRLEEYPCELINVKPLK